jgi:hypothetical protein
MGRKRSTHGRNEKCKYEVSIGKAEGKRPPGIPRRNWEYNIKMDPKFSVMV